MPGRPARLQAAADGPRERSTPQPTQRGGPSGPAGSGRRVGPRSGAKAGSAPMPSAPVSARVSPRDRAAGLSPRPGSGSARPARSAAPRRGGGRSAAICPGVVRSSRPSGPCGPVANGAAYSQSRWTTGRPPRRGTGWSRRPPALRRRESGGRAGRDAPGRVGGVVEERTQSRTTRPAREVGASRRDPRVPARSARQTASCRSGAFRVRTPTRTSASPTAAMPR